MKGISCQFLSTMYIFDLWITNENCLCLCLPCEAPFLWYVIRKVSFRDLSGFYPKSENYIFLSAREGGMSQIKGRVLIKLSYYSLQQRTERCIELLLAGGGGYNCACFFVKIWEKRGYGIYTFFIVNWTFLCNAWGGGC